MAAFFRNDNTDEIAALKLHCEGLGDQHALNYLSDILTRDPWSRAGNTVLAEYYLKAGELQKALDAVSRSLSIVYDDIYAQGIYLRAMEAMKPEFARQRATIEGQLKERICPKPFEHFEVAQGGEVFMCCPSYLPVPIGDLKTQSVEEIWNSPKAHAIRASILDGSYRYCSRLTCGAIASMELKTNYSPIRSKTPPRIQLTHDLACNLSCPSCRTKAVGNLPEKRTEFQSIEEKLAQALDQAVEISALGSGDPIASRSVQAIFSKLDSTKNRKLLILIQTNGLLFTREWWERSKNLHGFKIDLMVSIDAARADSYARIRRGGDFSLLLKNLEFMSELYQAERLNSFAINFVVQAENFREMVEFVKLGKRLKVTRVRFSRIRNWGTYSAENFLERDVSNPSHPLHREFQLQLQNPIFRSAHVSLGDLGSLAPAHSALGVQVMRVMTKLKVINRAKRIFETLPPAVQRPVYRMFFRTSI